jgi:hypothetical protein
MMSATGFNRCKDYWLPATYKHDKFNTLVLIVLTDLFEK